MHDLFGAIAVRFLRGQFTELISARLPNPLSEQEKELLKEDIHGGWWETSMMLMLHPELVGKYDNLPSTRRADKKNGTGYFGSPSMASREFAELELIGQFKTQALLKDRSVPMLLKDATLAPRMMQLDKLHLTSKKVKDRGVGIPAADLPRIFEPFFTTRRTGSGLGLALARNVLEALGGSIAIDSQVDAGTTVRIDLPDRPAGGIVN